MPELGEDYWRRVSSAGTPSAPSRSIRTASESSPNGSATECSSPSRYGTTSEPSTGDRGLDASTLSAADSLVRTSPALAPAEGWTAIARACGSKCSESLARFGLRMSSPKTLRTCALEAWTSSSKGLPNWGLLARGGCSELGTSVRPTDATACGSLLPTPTGAGNEGSPSMQKWPAHRALKARLPTPIASDRNGDRPRGAGSLARGGGQRLTRIGGSWIALREWMMGWPLGWSSTRPMPKERWNEWLECFSQRRAQVRPQAFSQAVVRDVSRDGCAGGAPSGQEPAQQFARELPNALRDMPHATAHSGGRLGETEAPTQDMCGVSDAVSAKVSCSPRKALRECGVRGGNRKTDRGAQVEQVKATGNGQVPAVAALAWRVLSDALSASL